MEQCYICLDDDTNLIKPCNTEKCSGRVHEDCLREQCITDEKCGICRNNIILEKTITFNTKNCILSLLNKIFFLIMGIITPLSIYLIMMCRTLEFYCDRVDNNCKEQITIPICYFIIICCVSYAFLLISYYMDNMVRLREFIKNYFYVDFSINTKRKIFILYILICLLTILSHFIGQPIIKKYLELDDFFNWRTSTTGLIIYLLLIAAMLLIFAIYNMILYIYHMSFDEFYEKQINLNIMTNNV